MIRTKDWMSKYYMKTSYYYDLINSMLWVRNFYKYLQMEWPFWQKLWETQKDHVLWVCLCCDCMCKVHIIHLELFLIYHLLFFSYFKKIVIYFLVALALHCCMWAFSGYNEHGAVHAKLLSSVQLFAMVWTLSMGFSRQKH